MRKKQSQRFKASVILVVETERLSEVKMVQKGLIFHLNLKPHFRVGKDVSSGGGEEAGKASGGQKTE